MKAVKGWRKCFWVPVSTKVCYRSKKCTYSKFDQEQPLRSAFFEKIDNEEL